MRLIVTSRETLSIASAGSEPSHNLCLLRQTHACDILLMSERDTMVALLAARPSPTSSLDRRFDRLEILLEIFLERLFAMSATFETDLTAQSAAMAGLTAEVGAGLAANAAAIQGLKDQIAAGGTVSAADLATLEGNTAAALAATTALEAALNPPVSPPPPPPAP